MQKILGDQAIKSATVPQHQDAVLFSARQAPPLAIA
jgi:hypothetical protein